MACLERLPHKSPHGAARLVRRLRRIDEVPVKLTRDAD